MSHRSRPVDRMGPAPKRDPEKPLFIPLMSKPFAEFLAGTKKFELRLYGPRWNEKTCRIGRRVVLSRGYGTRSRLFGSVCSFDTALAGDISTDWATYFPDATKESKVACIGIKLNAVQQLVHTALNPADRWPFPSSASAKPGLRYIDAEGVERVYSRKEGRA